ncbi:MAG: DUF3987 domain-containing protein, partial [Planctomycetes bacterium]|nr:DUF3987 domain-containing protein [Planctomycetota bacterium]
AAWWQRWPDANIGIQTGAPSGTVTLDIDPRHGGDSSLAALEAKHGELPATVEALTGGGGRHLSFQHPGGEVRNRTNLLPGIDVRGDGGYVVADPSIHASGIQYRWRDGHSPRDREPAPLPGWLHELTIRPEPATVTVPAGHDGNASAKLMDDAGRYVARATGVAEGARNKTAFSLAGHLAAFQTDAGERLTEGQIVDLLRPWNRRNSPPLCETELVQAVRSAMTNGTPRAMHTVRTTPRPSGKRSEARRLPHVEPYKSFPLEALPEPMRTYVQAVAAATGKDPAYAALAALVVVAGSIGNRAAVLVKRGWVEPAVLWGVLVGRSGTIKTHVLKLVAQPLIDLYKASRLAFVEAMQQYRRDMEHYGVRLANWKQAERKGPATDPPEQPEQPHERRVLVSDITVEKLGCVLEENLLGLCLVRDEMAAWVGAFDRYAAGGKGSDQPAWLSMYDAGPVTIDRKSNKGTLFIERAAVSVLGTIQPGTLVRLFGVAEREAGLLGRLLLAYPPEQPALWTEAELSEEMAAVWRDLVSALQTLPACIDETGGPRPRLIPISEDAKPIWIAWHDQHAREVAEMPGDDLAAHYGKLKGACARIALLCACVEVAAGAAGAASISADHMQRAIRVVEWFKHEARRVYAILGEDEGDLDHRRLLELIRRNGGHVTARDLMRCRRQFATAADAEAALGALVEAGLGRWEYPRPGSKGGQPSQRFVLADDTAGGTAGDGVDVDRTAEDEPTAAGMVNVNGVDGTEHDGDGCPPDEVPPRAEADDWGTV